MNLDWVGLEPFKVRIIRIRKENFDAEYGLLKEKTKNCVMRMRIRIQLLLLFKVKRICDYWSTDSQRLHFEPSRLQRERPGHPRLQYGTPQPLNFDNDADPDPACDFIADPDPAFHFKRVLRRFWRNGSSPRVPNADPKM